MKSVGLTSKILLYHLITFEKLTQIHKEYDWTLSLNKISDLIENIKWKIDKDIHSIQYSESGKNIYEVN